MAQRYQAGEAPLAARPPPPGERAAPRPGGTTARAGAARCHTIPALSSIGVAIIGYGLAGAVFHAPLISATPELEVRAVVTGNPERRRQAASDLPGARLHARVDELWHDHSGIGLVVVATPNHLHAPQTIAALERGMAVVVDKPMALSTAEASAMIAAAERTGGLLAPFHNRRYDSDFRLLRETVGAGGLGGLLRLESRFERFHPEPRPGAWREQTGSDQGGGLLLDLGSHLIDQVLLLLGRPQSVYAEVDTVRQGVSADDDCFLALRFAGGATAHVWVSNLTPSIGPRWRAWGRRAALEVWGLDPQEPQIRSGMRPGDPAFGEPGGSQRAVLTAPDGSAADIALPAGRYRDFYAEMAAAMRGEGPVPVTGSAGWDVLAVVEAARRSAASGTLVAPATPAQE